MANTFFIWLAAIAVMIALPFIGHTAKGANRWIEFGGFTFQPSEYMKPALVIAELSRLPTGQTATASLAPERKPTP